MTKQDEIRKWIRYRARIAKWLKRVENHIKKLKR